MKILITIYDLQSYGGTETFTYTLSKELLRKGHEVYCFCANLGKVAEKLIKEGVIVTDRIEKLPKDINVIHAQHRMEALIVYGRYPNTPMVYVSHGVAPWQEQPIFLPTIYKYVVISEEIKSHLVATYNIEEEKVVIIRNGVDLNRFYSISEINNFPQKMLLLSNRFTNDVLNTVKEVCEGLSLSLEIIGQSINPKWNVENYINTADIVVSLGRGILETMACGRIAFVYDYNGGDGIVTPSNYFILREKNFSGRTLKINYNAELMIKEIIRLYNKQIAKENIEIIKKYHDISIISDIYLQIYRESLSHCYNNSLSTDKIFYYLGEIYRNICNNIKQKEENAIYLKEVILERKAEIENKEKNIRYLIELASEKDDIIKKYQENEEKSVALLFEKEKELSTIKERLRRSDKLTDLLLSGIKKKERKIKYFKKVIKDNSYKICEPREEIERLHFQNNNYILSIKQKEENILYLLNIIRNQNKELNSIYNSKSWRYVNKIKKAKDIAIKYMSFPGLLLKKLLRHRINVKENEKVNIPLISVVMPVYDRTKMLIESIESILQQTYQNFELILVCDGSPKETLEIVKSYESHSKVRVFYFNNNSGNAVRGRNKGIKEARGKYLAFQDSDDVAASNRLELSLAYIEKYGADVVYGGWRAIVDGTREISIKNNQEIYSPECDYATLKEICVPCQSTVMVRLEAIRNAGGFKSKMKYREDHEMWLRMAYLGYKFKSIPEVLTNLRLHKDNLELKFIDDDKYWYELMIKEHTKIPKLKPKIAYVIPGCGISGGIAVICQHTNRLLKRGYDVIMISEDGSTSIDWFPEQYVEIIPISRAPDNFDIMVATGWSTAYTIKEMQAKRKIYFVQSDESRFYDPDSKESKNAKKTYEFDYEFMTEVKWIKKWLKDYFNKDAFYVPNGLDEEIFYKTEPIIKKGNKVRVLLEGPIDIPFKGMKDAFEVVKDLDCEVWCVSSAGRPKSSWRCDYFFEKVPYNKMKNIYSSCDILLKMSRVEGFFGPPLEMMACGGTCVVSEVTGYDEYIIDGYNALVVKQGDITGAKGAVKLLIENKLLRDELIKNGKTTAQKWRWEPTIDILERIFLKE